MRVLFSILSFFLFFVCCNDSEPSSTDQEKKEISTTSKCKYGEPVAIFAKSLEKIKRQSFESKGQRGVETVEFSDGRLLELFQSGCNEIRQEYRFTIAGNFRDEEDSFWFKEAVSQMTFLAQLDEQYVTYGLYAGAITQLVDQMRIGQFIEAEANTFIMVDKIVESETSLVIIVFERRG